MLDPLIDNQIFASQYERVSVVFINYYYYFIIIIISGGRPSGRCGFFFFFFAFIIVMEGLSMMGVLEVIFPIS